MDRLELIAAFAAGERVDAKALRAALADEAARDYLIELVAMREIVTEFEDVRNPGSDVRSPGSLDPGYPKTLTLLAAALAVAVGLAGYAIGQQRSQVVTVAVHPPLEADVVVSLEAPPAATQVIPLGNGVSGTGGR